MNLIERTIEMVYQRVRAAGGPLTDADQLALGTAFLVQRGGRALEDVIENDMDAWVARYGPPTREKLGRWAAGLGIEAGLAKAALRASQQHPAG